jgi:hypothetical protein
MNMRLTTLQHAFDDVGDDRASVKGARRCRLEQYHPCIVENYARLSCSWAGSVEATAIHHQHSGPAVMDNLELALWVDQAPSPKFGADRSEPKFPLRHGSDAIAMLEHLRRPMMKAGPLPACLPALLAAPEITSSQ